MQTKRQKHESQRKLRIDDLLTFDPLTENQLHAREAWKDGDHLVLSGSAGTVVAGLLSTVVVLLMNLN